MIKGLVITPPILGRISIGRVVEKEGRRLPQKEDQFTLTTLIQNKDGWLLHPLDTQLRPDKNSKLRSIPVMLLFNDPALNLRTEYSAFDKDTGRPVCVGNGEECKRRTDTGLEKLPCPSPDLCSYGQAMRCKPYGRLNVRIGNDDELGTFIFRTTGFNSIRTLTARLSYYQAGSGNRLACLPLALRLRGKSTTQSHRSAVYYVDLTLRDGMTLEQAITEATETDRQRQASGFDQQALDEAARLGFANGLFEDNEEELPQVLEEFYPADTAADNASPTPETRQTVSGLRARLETKAALPAQP